MRMIYFYLRRFCSSSKRSQRIFSATLLRNTSFHASLNNYYST